VQQALLPSALASAKQHRSHVSVNNASERIAIAIDEIEASEQVLPEG
jgi:hypothetical protein